MYTPRDRWITNYADVTKFEMERSTQKPPVTLVSKAANVLHTMHGERPMEKSQNGQTRGFPCYRVKNVVHNFSVT